MFLMLTDGHLGTLSSGETVGTQECLRLSKWYKILARSWVPRKPGHVLSRTCRQGSGYSQRKCTNFIPNKFSFSFSSKQCPILFFCHIHTWVQSPNLQKLVTSNWVLSLVNNNFKKEFQLQGCKGGKDKMKSNKASPVTGIWPPPLRLWGVRVLSVVVVISEGQIWSG